MRTPLVRASKLFQILGEIARWGEFIFFSRVAIGNCFYHGIDKNYGKSPNDYILAHLLNTILTSLVFHPSFTTTAIIYNYCTLKLCCPSIHCREERKAFVDFPTRCQPVLKYLLTRRSLQSQRLHYSEPPSPYFHQTRLIRTNFG